MAVVLYIAICVCAIAYPYFSNLIKILSNNREIRKLKEEERELEDKILSNNRKISSNNREIRKLKEEERELEEEIKKIKMVLEKLERYKN